MSRKIMALSIGSLSFILISIIIILLLSSAKNFSKNDYKINYENNYGSDRDKELIAQEYIAMRKYMEFQNIKLIWENELAKKIEDLTLEDFSDNPIEGTPEEYVDLIIEVSNRYGYKASLLSAHIFKESTFNSNSIFNPWKQIKVWDNKKNKWVYKWIELERSVGLAQINLMAHSVQKVDAKNPEFAVNWMANRINYTREAFSHKDLFYTIMAYNSYGAAKNADLYMNGKLKNPRLIEDAKFIMNYATSIMEMARKQRLKEIYESLFSKYNNNYPIPEFLIEINI